MIEWKKHYVSVDAVLPVYVALRDLLQLMDAGVSTPIIMEAHGGIKDEALKAMSELEKAIGEGS
jgi:hypothetical protein